MVESLTSIQILLVCTGNICRSPMAEGLLRSRLERRGIGVRVHSAGLCVDGEPASERGVDTLRHQHGIDLRGHRSRALDARMIDHADLILGMARTHVHTVAQEQPDAFGRTFTLKELVRRATDIGVRADEEPLDSWLARLHDGRLLEDLRGASPDDDVADPIGQSAAVYRQTAGELDRLMARLVEAIWGSRPATNRRRVGGIGSGRNVGAPRPSTA